MKTITFDKLPAEVQKINERLAHIENLLASKREPEPDIRFTIQQVADYLHIAISTIYCRVSNRSIPHEKRGGRLYFVKSEIDAWLSQGKRKTLDELRDEV